MNQTKLWSDPKVRAERRAKAEAFMRRPMDLDPIEPAPKRKREQPKRKAA
jgi:hypothetical protein